MDTQLEANHHRYPEIRGIIVQLKNIRVQITLNYKL